MDGEAKEVLAALEDLAEGRVQRSRHHLLVDGRDVAPEFLRILEAHGYRPARIRDLDVPRGVRFPAFLVQGGWAEFGHVFQEKFHDVEYRTLFGSAARDWRGDWAVILTRRSPETVWVDLERGVPFDEDRPSGL